MKVNSGLGFSAGNDSGPITAVQWYQESSTKELLTMAFDPMLNVSKVQADAIIEVLSQRIDSVTKQPKS